MFEVISSDDPKQPPTKVEYYDLSGALLVSYAPSGGARACGRFTTRRARRS
ncbi:hypothetical protein [Nannocystis pusilla]|uniref:hypothetical protein n=1 Tax=Nannocystis pusilla TaxID=889268 RepID=UPI003B7FA9CA